MRVKKMGKQGARPLFFADGPARYNISPWKRVFSAGATVFSWG